MAGFKHPNYTQAPNQLFDELMAVMGEAELRIVLVAVRKTLGYHKTHDAISLSQFMKMSGLSRQGALDGIEAAKERGLLCELEKRGARGVKHYGLVISPDQSTEETSTSQASRPVTSQRSRPTKETVKKEKEKKDPTPNGGAQPLSKKEANGKPTQGEAAGDSTHGNTLRRELHDVTERMLGLKSAAYPLIEKWVNFLTGTTPEYTTPRKGEKARRNGVWHEYQIQPGMDAAEIGAFGRWYRSTHPGIDLPSKCDSMNLHVSRFRAVPDHDHLIAIYRRDLEVQAYRAVPPIAPAVGNEESITEAQRAEAAAMMEALTAKLGAK